MSHVDVAIIGAGPVGLLLAIELAIAGVDCVVLETRAEPDTVQKALSLGPLGAEALMRRGFSSQLDALEAHTRAVMAPFMQRGGWGTNEAGKPRFSGHFGGIPLLTQPIDRARPTRLIDQRFLQECLLSEVQERGIPLRRPCTVTDVQSNEESVTLSLHGADGRKEALACRYAIGCDGGRSFMRRHGQFAFPGTAPSLAFYQVFAEFADPDQTPPPGWLMQPGGVLAYGPVPGRLFMVDFSGPSPKELRAPSQTQVEEALARVCGHPVPLKAFTGGRCWADHTRLVDTYRKGRLILAGDAAHIHPPFGGQGLGLGLVDAANLGWKLAAVVNGRMPETLLDSYEAERRPVAREVLDNTLAQTALMRPDPQSRALRALMAQRLSDEGESATLSSRIKGFTLRYSLGGSHDAVGRLVADQPLCDGRQLYDLMATGRGVFLQAQGVASGRRSRFPSSIAQGESEGKTSCLIRPDGCIAWAGEGNDVSGLDDAMARWFESNLPGAALTPCS
ncbi:FAD-dependent monooxygenase [Asaia spathodeae]|uniref:FAD-dependent monooxygenase n=1 Tax=Asaia spathodeae TaxID=657016 RepID=A0ABX2P476_9PROT|nr:FAD-dependent monooxygenase [Asaia spathodeae]GBR21378.1 2-polyprenyl-6-methoxyphenol hydroxylase [Asaia spathodeae NBRC 105894]